MAKNASQLSTAKTAGSVAKAAKVGAGGASAAPTVEQRRQMIAEAAYYIAERRGFTEGCPDQDWYEAEQQIDRALGASTPRH
jgi:hypothetical protein